MPRRNLVLIVAVALISLVCYQRVQRNPYGRVLAEAIATIENRYVEPITAAKLFEGAMNGMVRGLDDYSAFISPADLQAFHETIDQEFVGVGMEVALDPQTKQLMVLSPLVGSPAQQADIRAGDIIQRIGQAGTQGMSLKDAVGLLRGKPGEPVTLTVLHAGEPEPVEITIVRQKIQVPTVLGDRRTADGGWDFFLEGHNRIGYVRINCFTDKTVGELERTLQKLVTEGMRGLILDLRDDPGGYLEAAVDVSDLFIDSGPIVSIRRREGRIGRTYTASGRGPYTDFPMAVLINQHTASSAEIVAACLQDHRRATIVGQRSFGKGTIQEVIDLEKGCGAMKLTTANYWRPNGKNIHRPSGADENADWGVTPDQSGQIPLDTDEQTRWRLWRSRRDVSHPGMNNQTDDVETEPFVDRPLALAAELVEKQAARD